MNFILDNNALVTATMRIEPFLANVLAQRCSFIKRVVRNWSIFISQKTMVVYDAHGRLFTGFDFYDDTDRINERVSACPVSVKRVLCTFIDSYWHRSLAPVYQRDASGMSDRTFGIELEFCFPNQWTRESLCAHMRDLGLDITCLGYTHEVRANWKMTTDASVRSEVSGYNSCEISSPILHGREGLLEVNKLCQILDDCGCIVNKTCGFHVHHGARDLSEHQRLAVIDFYRKNETIFDTIVSPSRRADVNSYCHSLREYPSNTFISNRYVKVNACSYSKYGTLEFRQHQGTINYQKIANWIKLTQRVMEITPDMVHSYSSLEQMLHALDLDILRDFFTTRARELAR